MDELKRWVNNEMPADIWMHVNAYQLEAVKHLISEYYGWPEFTLNINKSGDRVMKIEI